MANENEVELDVSVAPLPTNFSGGPQALAQAIADRLIVKLPAGNSTFVVSDAAPASDQGPWLNTSIQPPQWYTFDPNEGEYTPTGVAQQILGYTISQGEPDPDLFNLWFQLDSIGQPVAIRNYDGSIWRSFERAGKIAGFMGSQTPAGWLLCDGAQVKKDDFKDLYDVLQDGTGTGIFGETTTRFDLPDMRGEYVRGWDNGRGMDTEAGSRDDRGDGFGGDLPGTVQYFGADGSPLTGSGGNPDIRPRNRAVNWCIKY